MATSAVQESFELLDSGSTAEVTQGMTLLNGLVKMQLDRKVEMHQALVEKYPNDFQIRINHGKLLAAQALRTYIEEQLDKAPREEVKLWVYINNPAVKGINFTKVSDLGKSLIILLDDLDRPSDQFPGKPDYKGDELWVQIAINSVASIGLYAAYQYWSSLEEVDYTRTSTIWNGRDQHAEPSLDAVLLDKIGVYLTTATNLHRAHQGEEQSDMIGQIYSSMNALGTIYMSLTAAIQDDSTRWERQTVAISQFVSCGENAMAEKFTDDYKTYNAMRELFKLEYFNIYQTYGPQEAIRQARIRLGRYSKLAPELEVNYQICRDLLNAAEEEQGPSTKGFYRRMVLDNFSDQPQLPEWIEEWAASSSLHNRKAQSLDLTWLYKVQKKEYLAGAADAFLLAEMQSESLSIRKTQLFTAKALLAAEGIMATDTDYSNEGVQLLSRISQRLAEVDLQEKLEDGDQGILDTNTLLDAYMDYLQQQCYEQISILGDEGWQIVPRKSVLIPVLALLDYLVRFQPYLEAPQSRQKKLWELLVKVDGEPNNEQQAPGTSRWTKAMLAMRSQGVAVADGTTLWADEQINGTLINYVLDNLCSLKASHMIPK
eukprot:Ihof_evm3s548 gene=Ihof_evmTU3s548